MHACIKVVMAESCAAWLFRSRCGASLCKGTTGSSWSGKPDATKTAGSPRSEIAAEITCCWSGPTFP